MKRVATFLVGFVAVVAVGLLNLSSAHAQVSISAFNTPVTIDFNGWQGAGFTPTPGAGQLDSDDWAITGLSTGNLNFGGTQTSGDFARGITTGGVATGGLYALNAGGGDYRFMIQPSGSDFTPGTLTLRIQNNTGQALTELEVSYEIYVNNDQNSIYQLDFAYSSDNATYTTVAAAHYETPGTADALGFVYAVTRTVNITGINVPNGAYFYLRWIGDDVTGGARDEIALDNISITAPAPTANVGMYVFTNNSTAISNPGLDLANVVFTAGTDDALSNAIDLPFTFYFNGQPYNQVKISSNGWVALGYNNSFPSSLSSVPLNDPENWEFNNTPMLAVLWDDLRVGNNGAVSYEGNASTFKVRWRSMEWGTATSYITFELTLTASGNGIMFSYGNGTNNSNQSATVGLINDADENAPNNYLVFNGNVVPGNEVQDANANANTKLITNDNLPPNVSSVPSIATQHYDAIAVVASSPLDFGSVDADGGTASQSVTLVNVGANAITVNGLTFSNSQFSSSYSGVIPAGAQATATITFTGNCPSSGQVTGTMTVNVASGVVMYPNNGTNLPLQATETHPDLAVSGTLNFPQTLVGSSTSLTITLTNNGTSAWTGTLSLTGTGAASFTVSPASVTVNPGESVDVTVTFAPTGAGHAAAADPMTWVANYSGVSLVVPEGNQTCNGGNIATLSVSASSIAPRVSIAVPLSTDVPGNQGIPTLDLGNRIFGPSLTDPNVPESFSEQFLVKNTGSADLTIADIANLNSGNLNDRFSATAVLVTGSTNLAPGDEAVYRITYTPQVTDADFPWTQGTSFGVKPGVEIGATSYSFDALITDNSEPVPTDAGFWHNYANGASSTFAASENLSQAGTLNATIRMHRGFLRAIKAQANSSEQAPINTNGVPKLSGSGLVIREGGVDVPATDVGDAGIDLEVTSYWGAVNDLLPWGGVVTFAGAPGKTSFYIVNNGNAVATFYVRQSIYENGAASAAFTLDGPFASSGVSYQSVTINGEAYIQFTLEPLYSQDPADPANNLSYVRFDVVFSPNRSNTPDLNNIGADRIGTIQILTDANLPTGAAQSANLLNTYSINIVGHVKYYDPAIHVGSAIADNVDFGKHELADATSSDKPLGYYAPAEELARRGVAIPPYFGVRDTVIVYRLVNHGNAPMRLSAGDIQAFALTGAPGAFHVVKITTPELVAAAGAAAPADVTFPFDLQPIGWTGVPSPSSSTTLLIWVHYDAGSRSTGSVGISNGVVRLVQSFVGTEFPTVELQYSNFGEGIRPFPVVDVTATGTSDVVIDGSYTRPAPVYRAWREAIYDNYCGLLSAPQNRDTVHLHLTVGNGIPAPTSVGNVNDGAVTNVYLYFDQAQVYGLGGPGNNIFIPAPSSDFSIDFNTPAVIRDALGNPVSTVDLNATPIVELPAYHTLTFDVIFRPSQLMPPPVGVLRGVVRIPHSNRNNDVDFTYDGDVYKYLELIVEGSSLRPALRTELGDFASQSFGPNYLAPNSTVNFDLAYPYRPGVFSGDSNFVAITLRNSQETGNSPTGADFSTGKIGIKAIFIEGVDFPDFEIVGFDLPTGVGEPNPVAYPIDPAMIGALGAGKSFIQWVADLGGGATVGDPYMLDINGIAGKPAVNLYVHFKPRPFVDGQRKAKRHAVLRIITTDICQPEIVFNLEGTALFADVVADPPQIDFGNVQINDIAQQTITLTNNGNFPAYFDTQTLPATVGGGPLYSHYFNYLNLGFALYGNQPVAYNLVGDTQTPLLPGQSRTLVVEFSPTQVGRREAQLDVTYIPDVPPTVGVNILQIPITGKGVNPVSLTLDPANGILDFGNVFVGQSAQLVLTLVNNGDADVSVQLPPSAVGPFTHDAGSGSIVVAANSSVDITFTFTPTALGSASATFTFYSPDAMGDQYYEVTCVGNGISAAAFSEDMVDFGAVRVFTEASTELYIDNSGGAYDVVAVFNGITGANKAEYRVEYQGSKLQVGDVIAVAAGDVSDPIVVTFAPNVLPADPSQPNIRTAQLNFTLDGASVTIDLSGDGAVPQIEFSSPDIVNGMLDFGTVDKTVGAQRTVTVQNIGRYPLAITQLAIIGAHADAFQLAAPSGIELGAGESFDVVITLLPGDELDITDARLVAESNSIQARSVELRGLRAVPGVALSATAVEFGNVRVGEVSNQVLTIRNATGLPVEVRGLSLTGPAQADFTIVSVSKQLPAVLEADNEIVVNLRFVPTEAGDKFARLYVETNTGQAEVQLFGRAVAPGVALSAQTLNFGSLPVGRSREMSLSVTNTGTAPLVIYAVKVEGQDAEMFRADNTVGFTLQPGASQTVRVTFTPLSSGLKYAFLRFVTDEYGVVSATLMGIGGAPEISVASTLDFGEVSPNSFRELQLTITNNGDAPLEISEAMIVGPAQESFSVETPTPILIASGSTGMLTIRFAPTTGGEKRATLRLINNTGIPAEVELVGRATVTSVDDEQADIAPAKVAILSVDPMPVHTAARVTYYLPETAHIRLALFDAAGREVLRLYEGLASAGQQMLTFEMPATLSSGSYFLRLETAGTTVTYPVTIAK